MQSIPAALLTEQFLWWTFCAEWYCYTVYLQNK